MIVYFLTPNQINHHLIVFFFISKTFTGSLSTSKGTAPTACGSEKFPVHNHHPKQNSFTAELIQDLPLQSGHPAPHRVKPAAVQGWALCGWRGGRRVCGDPPQAPLTIYMSIVKPKLPRPGPLRAARRWVLSFSLHGALKPLAASRHLANSL